ncbi:Bug family tripartite tricarboxylate transporter substrate binding protein [Acidovorax sp. SDU_ACID1]|uniref:Bug family tripartite tricarboxylate transporter substrate binding protein n=1 Tax=Acidovorax sp. SDU_ACID1 TaxID=3136632 RepID=UPI0038731869
MPTTRRTLIAAAATFAVFSAAHAAEGDYPSRPITIVVPHAPGGPVDGVARMFADKLKDELGQSVVVENRAGASSMIGAASVARSAPDGYTLYINASLHSINPLLYKNSIKYDSVKDFTPISLLAQGPLAFLVNPHVKATTAQEFAKEIKASPEKISFATGGFGAADHLASAYFLHEIGRTDVPIVLYKGGAPALQDLMGGAVQAKMDAMLTALPLVKGGKVRALAVTGATRSPLLPDVPTMREAGFKDFEFSSWYGFWAPANLPPAIAKRLDQAARNIMALPEVQNKLASQGFAADYRSSAAFVSFMDSETKRYQTIIDAAKIKVD